MIPPLNSLIRPGEEGSDKLVFPLKHRYSSAGLSPSRLKGIDIVFVNTLKKVADLGGFTLSLGIVDAKATTYSRRDNHWNSIIVGHFVDWDGTIRGLGDLAIKRNEDFPRDSLFTRSSDDEREIETGNEGVEYEKSYQAAAVLLWRNDQTLNIMLESGFPCVINCLLDTITAKGGPVIDLRSTLSRVIKRHNFVDGEATAVTNALLELDELEETKSFLKDLLANSRQPFSGSLFIGSLAL